MQFTLGCIGQQLGFDAKAEIADANNYPQVRTGRHIAPSALGFVPCLEQRFFWAAANSAGAPRCGAHHLDRQRAFGWAHGRGSACAVVCECGL